MNYKEHPWMGVFAATLCTFKANEEIDEVGLREYFARMSRVDELKGLVCNGHTGEIMSLREKERTFVTKVLAEEIRKSGTKKKVITGICGEGSITATEQSLAAKEVGADAILLMPPHYQLRFGRSSQTAIDFIHDVADGADIDIILHQYPSWTKVGYTLNEMLEIVKHPRVVCIKMGTRDMARWLYDYEKLKEAKPDLSIITCHDEYLLPTLLEAGDGALIGFAGFTPELMIKLVHACVEGNLKEAKNAQKTVAPLARLVYNFGEPGSYAHQRMKVALWLMGKISSPVFRRPIRPISKESTKKIADELNRIGYETPNAKHI
jgi:4-hydroxy-tetrahydrodipicolinate synthase